MTAYGRSFSENAVGQCTVEISCVNRRHLEVHLALPKELLRFEHSIRKKVSESLSRGNLTVKANFRFNDKTPFSFKPNLPLCKQQFEGWKEIAKALGKNEEEIALSFLQREAVFLLEEDEEALSLAEELIMNALDNALLSMQEMMRQEGSSLIKDIQDRLIILSKDVDAIEILSPKVVERKREELTLKLKELFPLVPDNEERVLREVCLIAEKADIAEEITRLRSHFLQFEETLNDEKSQGKKLEFIVQEMHREINTIASKSQEKDIARYSIEFKTELERIREQLQNVE